MTVEIHFVLHVANGIHIIFSYTYMISYTNTSISIRILE